MKWLTRLFTITMAALLMAGCEAVPETEPAPPAEPAAAAEPAASEPPAEPVAEQPAEEQSSNEAEQGDPGQKAVTAVHAWAPGKEGKLLLGLDGGLYEPYQPKLVEQVQVALREQGLYIGEAHGVLDKATMRALGEFQMQHGLQPSGVPTPRTRQVLLAPDVT